MMKFNRLHRVALATMGAVGMVLGATGAFAAGSVSWTSPANNSSFLVGTVVHPEGTAQGFGIPGLGLDLALVLDASGSMGSLATVNGVTQTRLEWQAEAAVALVNSLPASNTAVAVVRFSTTASVPLSLTPTTSAADIVNAINAITTTNLTATGPGIVAAEAELNANGTAGRSKQMVVISDGLSNQGIDPVTAAANANTNSGIIVHGVSIPGGNTTEMANIANAGGGSFINASTEQGLQDLIDLFSGFGGSLVGVDQVDLTLPDGTVLSDVATNAFGNFKVPAPGYALELGNNLFVATAFFTDGTSATANLNLIGTPTTAPIPLPAAAWLLLGGLGGLGLMSRKRNKA